VRPTATAFEASVRQEERDAHRRLSVSGERRRLAVTFPVKFSMQGQMQWSAAFHRDGFCIITANLHLWNRSVTMLSRVTRSPARESYVIILTFVFCSTADQTFKVALQLFPPPREDVELQDPSATKYDSAITFLSQPQQSSCVPLKIGIARSRICRDGQQVLLVRRHLQAAELRHSLAVFIRLLSYCCCSFFPRRIQS
jgi:hypothetical protein